MTATFKTPSTLPLALAIGSEVGTVLSLGDKEISVEFPVYGAQFNLGIQHFDISEGDAPINVKPKPEPSLAELTTSDLKRIGKLYQGFQIPLDLDAQGIVNAWTTSYIVGVITGSLTATTVDTVMKFSNGTLMPITTPDWIAFATWFKDERGKFFK